MVGKQIIDSDRALINGANENGYDSCCETLQDHALSGMLRLASKRLKDMHHRLLAHPPFYS